MSEVPAATVVTGDPVATPVAPAPAAVTPPPAVAATPAPITSEEVQKMIDAQVATQVSALKANSERLIAENKAVKDKLAGYGNVDVEQYQAFQQQIENNEETKLIADGKITEVVDKRTAKMRESLELQVTKAQNDAKTAAEQMNQYKRQSEEILIDNALRNAILGSEQIEPRAMDDLISRGRTVFKVAEGNKIEPRDENGLLMVGTDGTTPMTPNEYIESLRPNYPYYWKQSSPAGMTGMAGMPETDASARLAHAATTGDQAAYQAARREQLKARRG